MSVNGGALQHDKTSLTARAGTEVVLVSNNSSVIIPHNWVLAQTGTEAAAAAATGLNIVWVNETDQAAFQSSTSYAGANRIPLQ